jgi:hypothetical protein
MNENSTFTRGTMIIEPSSQTDPVAARMGALLAVPKSEADAEEAKRPKRSRKTA